MKGLGKSELLIPVTA